MTKYTNSDLHKYSYALFEVAVQQNALPELNHSVAFLKQELEQLTSELNKIHFYALDKKDQVEIATVLLENAKINKLLVDFVLILIHNRKIQLLEEFIITWYELQLIYQGYIKVEVITAVTLTEEQETEINKHLQSVYKSKYFINKTIDQSIIGGLIIRANGFSIDNSIVGQLNNLLNVMKG